MPQRDDTRLSRVVIDLLGPVPAERDLWVRSQIERSGKQIELASAEMQALRARESWITQRLISSKARP